MIQPVQGGPATSPPPLALTMGEPAGIGGELALAAWQAAPCCFFTIDDPARTTAAMSSHRTVVSPDGAVP